MRRGPKKIGAVCVWAEPAVTREFDRPYNASTEF